jgi:tetratricopeptide (TPR) repeat protein
MDDWSICAPDEERLEWLLGATRLADPGSAWRERARDLATWKSPTALAALAREAPVASESVSLLLIHAGLLLGTDLDASLALLRKTQAAHPSDFWANFALAESLDERQDPDAIGYYRAAVASRPEASAAHFNLGVALGAQNRTREAVESLQSAVALDPNGWKAQASLARALGREARYEEAFHHAEIAARLAPREPAVHRCLGLALKSLDRIAEAADSFRRGLELSPEGSELRAVFAADLARCVAAEAEKPPASRDR